MPRIAHHPSGGARFTLVFAIAIAVCARIVFPPAADVAPAPTLVASAEILPPRALRPPVPRPAAPKIALPALQQTGALWTVAPDTLILLRGTFDTVPSGREAPG